MADITPLADPTKAPSIIFDCSQCGECCNSIIIRVETEKALALKDNSWVKERLQNYNVQLSREDADFWTIPHKPDRTCVFLEDGNRCLIEHHEGKALKPSECRNFPFAGVQLPDGEKRFDCSASCRHVADQLIQHFKPILPDNAWAESLPVQKLGDNIRMSSFATLSWKTYFARQETALADFKSRVNKSSQAPESPLVIIAELLSSLACFKSIMSGKAVRVETEAFPAAKTAFLFWAIATFFLRKPYSSLSFWQIVTRGGYVDPFVFGPNPITLKTIFSNTFSASRWELEAQETLNAFAYGILRRYVLLSHGHWGGNIIVISAVGCILVVFYAQVLSWLKHGDASNISVGREEVVEAIRLTERYYTGHQPRFLSFFGNHFMGAQYGWLLQCLLFGL